jgi:tetratricopeptide (TPR) repeat protein
VGSDPDAAGAVAAAVALLGDLPPAERLPWIAVAQRRPSPRQEALLWVARASAELALGRPADAERSALEGCRTEPTVASAFTTAHLLAVFRGDAAAAEARLDEAEARFPPVEKPMSRAAIARERAWWAIRQGDPAAAQRIALDALAALAAGVRAPGHPVGRRNRGVVEVHGHLLQVLGVALLRQGHLEDALEAVDEAVAELATLPRQAQARMARMTRSEVLAALGRLPDARAEIDAVLAEADRQGHAEHAALAAAHAVALAVAAGETEEAGRWIATRGAAIRASGNADAVALFDRACAEWGAA